MEKKLRIASSPFLRNSKTSTQKIMLDVCIALLPAVAMSVYIFGLRALIIVALSTLSSIAFEVLFQALTKQKITFTDGSAAVTGLLIGLNIPASAPLWLPVFGSLIAIVLVKQLFGGLGQNFMNPAMIARTVLFISWASYMSARMIPETGTLFQGFVAQTDFVSVATPLGNMESYPTLWQLFFGTIPGMLGETSKLALLLGGLYLIYKNVIDWRIPVFMIGTVFVLFYIHTGVIYSTESGMDNALSQILSGGLFLAAFFMATDYVTCPIYKSGRILVAVVCGALIFVIRVYGNYPEGTSFAVLFMNILTPLVDKYTRPKSFGEV